MEALRGSARPGRGHASDAKRIGTRTKRGSRGLVVEVPARHLKVGTPVSRDHGIRTKHFGAGFEARLRGRHQGPQGHEIGAKQYDKEGDLFLVLKM